MIFRATLIPHVEFSADYLLNIVAVFGTTISPYLFFWQASEEVEEEILKGQIPDMGVGKPDVTLQGVIEMDRDTVVGMSYSQIIMFFIIVTTAATLTPAGSLQSRQHHRRLRFSGHWPAISPTCSLQPGSSARGFSRSRYWQARRRTPWPR